MFVPVRIAFAAALLFLAGCATTPSAKWDSRMADKAVPVPRVWLWAKADTGWINAGCQRVGSAARVTGVMLVETNETAGQMDAAAARVRSAGLELAIGVWHSQPDSESRGLLLSREWQAGDLHRLMRWPGPWVMDLEPYRDAGHWYSPLRDWPALAWACYPWRGLGTGTLYLTPGHPDAFHVLAVAANARLGGTTVKLVDQGGYYDWFTVEVQEQRRAWAESQGFGYVPAFRGAALLDTRYTARMAPECMLWFGEGDDLGAFGTSDWHPRPLRILPGDVNCDGVVNFGDIVPFTLLLHDPAGWTAAYRNCYSANGDMDGDGDVSAADVQAFVNLLTPR